MTVVDVSVSAAGAVVGEGEARHPPVKRVSTTAVAQSVLVFTPRFLAWEDRGWPTGDGVPGVGNRKRGGQVRLEGKVVLVSGAARAWVLPKPPCSPRRGPQS